MENFEKLLTLELKGKTDKARVNGREYTYLSWAWAWAEFVKVYPDAEYRIIKNEIGLPYFIDKAGAMVYVKVTADSVTHEMWLPVLNGANKPMKSEPYTYMVKGYSGAPPKQKTVEAINMFDVNKTVMRCLVKCLAMFGLGLYIYQKEDLPELSEEDRLEQMYPTPALATEKQTKIMRQQYAYIVGKQNVKEIEFRKFLISKGLKASDEMHKWLRDNTELLKLIEEFKGSKE